MVDKDMARDLLSFGVPILALGDPAQLPPVKGAGYFTQGVRPDTMLTEIHRQARDNPIIRAATDVREGRRLRHGWMGETVEIGRPGERSAADVAAADQIICGKNRTRQSFNERLRKHHGFAGVLPQPGDRLICTRNDWGLGILNGMMFEVRKVLDTHGDHVHMSVLNADEPEARPLETKVHKSFFDPQVEAPKPWELRGTQQFDFGYAITCHKAQGSQWDHVVVYDQSETFGDAARSWLYTAITRASNQLTLVM